MLEQFLAVVDVVHLLVLVLVCREEIRIYNPVDPVETEVCNISIYLSRGMLSMVYMECSREHPKSDKSELQEKQAGYGLDCSMQTPTTHFRVVVGISSPCVEHSVHRLNASDMWAAYVVLNITCRLECLRNMILIIARLVQYDA